MSQKSKRSKEGRPPSGRQGDKANAAQLNQATADEFEREGLGIAPKE